MKKILSICLVLIFVLCAATPIFADSAIYDEAEQANVNESKLSVDAKSAVLMEAKTGKVLYSKNAGEALPPASVTKIMTLLLVARAIDEGRISLSDKVTVSAEAASMGGSQIFLKEGEQMSVEELLKSTVIASANDAAVALAELVAGSESAFVDKMNEAARELGLKDTCFENTTGLDDTTTKHLTSAYDIALMSRELIKYDFILNFSSIWQDTVRNGEFTLTNTNRLVRYYSGCTGLKTGSTDKAGFCVSATAERGGMHLIAVVMGSPTRDARNNAARAMLDFGFAEYALYSEERVHVENIPVVYGNKEICTLYSSEVSFVVDKGALSKIEKVYSIPEKLQAPVKRGDVIGEITYLVDGKEVAKSQITANDDVSRISLLGIFAKIIKSIFTLT